MKLYFYKGDKNSLEESKTLEEKDLLKKIYDSFLKVLDNKNLSFLLGSGCSSYKEESKEIGIPVMAILAKDFYLLKEFEEKKEWLKNEFSIDVTDKNFKDNLESFLSILHSLSFYYSKMTKPEKDKAEKEKAEKINDIIQETRNFLLEKCLNIENSESADKPLIELYKQFYRKLLSRNPTLPRLNIFTTNYDLYSERAMDLLGIHYVNGFTGGISKFFNPAIFNYALAEKMDLSQSKWGVINNFFYLYKIHGSVNWIEADEENKLFKVKEIQEPALENLKTKGNIMIHPTPLKYNASLGSPYSDLFREFQKKLMKNNNILVTIGYSFSDEHINNLIYQAFTIPSFRLIVIGDPEEGKAIKKLLDLKDSRIWIIGGELSEGENNKIPLHFFKGFVEKIMPNLTAEDLDKKIETTINNLKELFK